MTEKDDSTYIIKKDNPMQLTEQNNDMHLTEKDSGVQSINRVLDIIEVLCTEQEGLGVTEIAKRVNLHKSTAHRLTTTLANRGYLNKARNGNYKIGLKLIQATSCYINSLELQTEARPYIAQITNELGLTAYLGYLDGDQVVYIEKMDVYPSAKMYAQIGMRVHAYCSSLGKCLLANYSNTELEVVMKDCSFIKFTPKTIDSMDKLHKEIAKVRKKGWGIDDEEHEIGHRCIGAPIYDYRGDIIASVSARGSVNVLTDERIEPTAEYLKNVAKEISQSMGYVE